MPSSCPDLEARRRRVSRIRRRVVGGAVALFALATGAITPQLVTGRDPALAKATAEATATSSDRSAASTSASFQGCLRAVRRRWPGGSGRGRWHGYGGYPGSDSGSGPSGSVAGGGSSSSGGSSGSSGQVAPLTTVQS
jgi:uncharacterized membrane protein YgcG